MVANDIKFTKDGMILNFPDEKKIQIDDVIATRIWYALEEKKIFEFVEENTKGEYNEIQRSKIRDCFIGRSETLKNVLADIILELALAEFSIIEETEK